MDPISLEIPQSVALALNEMLTRALTRARYTERTEIDGWDIAVRGESFGATVYVHLTPPRTDSPSQQPAPPASSSPIESQD